MPDYPLNLYLRYHKFSILKSFKATVKKIKIKVFREKAKIPDKITAVHGQP